jgi:hypothetical protein
MSSIAANLLVIGVVVYAVVVAVLAAACFERRDE